MRRLFLYIILYVTALGAGATGLAVPTFHDEAADTTRINAILKATCERRFANPEERTAFIAEQFVGTPYVAHTLEGETEQLRINTSELDCTTFVETVLALSMTAAEGRQSWRDFAYNLENLRYRRGEMNGYPSRLHYICEWFVDNEYRGNLTDATRSMPVYNYITRSIDYMTSNRDRYPSLADSANYARMKEIEGGYRNHRFPYVKTRNINDKAVRQALRTGDVVGLVSNWKNLDVTHMGIIIMKDGIPYLLHASSSNGKVEESAMPLADYLARSKNFLGIRIARLKE